MLNNKTSKKRREKNFSFSKKNISFDKFSFLNFFLVEIFVPMKKWKRVDESFNYSSLESSRNLVTT